MIKQYLLLICYLTWDKKRLILKTLSVVSLFLVLIVSSSIQCQWKAAGDNHSSNSVIIDDAGDAVADDGDGVLEGWEITKSNTGLKVDYSDLTAIDMNGADAALGTLNTYGSLTVITFNANVTIENKIITSELNLGAGGITLKNCLVKPAVVGNGMSIIHGIDCTIEDCEIDGSSLTNTDHITVSLSGSIRRCNIHGMSSGISIVNTGPVTSYCSGNLIHNLSYTEGSDAHMDGITVRISNGTGGIVIENNRSICSNAGHSTGAFFSKATAGNINNIRIERNLFEGYGYCLCVDDSGSYGYGTVIIISSNRINPYTGGAGPVNIEITSAEFDENYLYNSGAMEGKGTQINL